MKRAPDLLKGARVAIESHKAMLEVLFLTVGTISAILLGGMALIVSKRANEIALAQTEIASAQKEIAEREVTLRELDFQPSFRFEGGNTESGESLEIWNDGAPIESLRVIDLGFVMLDNHSADSMSKACSYFSAWYYRGLRYTGQKTGLLVTLYSVDEDPIPERPERIDSSAALHGLLTDYYRRLRELDPGAGSHARMVVFLDISYIDRSGKSHEVVYHINPTEQWPGQRYPERLGPIEAGVVSRVWGASGGILGHIEEVTVDDLLGLEGCPGCQMRCYH